MTVPDRPLSRRALMKAAGIAPLAAATACVMNAGPNTVEEDDGLAKIRELTKKVPEDQLEQVMKKAKANGLKKDKEKKFEAVARTLWSYFVLGLGDVPIKKAEKLMEFAYTFKTGNLIVGHVNAGKFDAGADHQLTSLCAHTCGHQAACIAVKECGADMGAEIDEAIYKKAWLHTEAVMKKKIKKVQEQGGSPAPERPRLGYGC